MSYNILGTIGLNQLSLCLMNKPKIQELTLSLGHCSIERFDSFFAAMSTLPETLLTLKLNLKYNYNLNVSLASSRHLLFNNLTRLETLSLHFENNNMDEAAIEGLS